jgi:hypothetical protein
MYTTYTRVYAKVTQEQCCEFVILYLAKFLADPSTSPSALYQRLRGVGLKGYGSGKICEMYIFPALVNWNIVSNRDEVLLDQQRDVVVEFGAWCILPVRSFESQNLTNLTQCSVNSVHCIVTAVGGRDCLSNSGTLASNRQYVYKKPEIHDDISLLMSQSLVSKQGLQYS